MVMSVKEFVVKRSQWIRGIPASKLQAAADKVRQDHIPMSWTADGNGNPTTSMLSNIHGHMCCLGFLGLACGATAGQLLGHGTPAQTSSSVRWPHSVFLSTYYSDSVGISNICSEILTDNDTNRYVDDAEREEALKDNFRALGIEVTFED